MGVGHTVPFLEFVWCGRFFGDCAPAKKVAILASCNTCAGSWALSAGLLLCSVVTCLTPKKNMHIAMCNMDSRDQKCILLCAIWIWTKNPYCYVQYGFARPKMKVEVEEKAPPVECLGLGILYINTKGAVECV